jgi:hypothetical protein
VIVGGDLGGVGDTLLTGIGEALDRNALPSVRAALELEQASWAREVLGALARGRRHRSAPLSHLAALHREAFTPVAR